ncbi:hypothetical protein Tco_1255244 [Tanacetum coccineum]
MDAKGGMRKFAKGEPSVHRDPLFDDIPEDTLDHMETENAQDVGRTRDTVGEEKENDENILSTEDVLSTDKEKVPRSKLKVLISKGNVYEEGSATQTTQTPTSTIFGDDETIAKLSRSFKQLASDEEMARKESTIRDRKARIKADRLLAVKLQEEKGEHLQ